MLQQTCGCSGDICSMGTRRHECRTTLAPVGRPGTSSMQAPDGLLAIQDEKMTATKNLTLQGRGLGFLEVLTSQKLHLGPELAPVKEVERVSRKESLRLALPQGVNQHVGMNPASGPRAKCWRVVHIRFSWRLAKSAGLTPRTQIMVLNQIYSECPLRATWFLANYISQT